MTDADNDDAQVENDPTGVRALLSSLPDPGPMPEAVVARISASLRDEQERREQQAAFGHDPSPDVISLAAERHRRRPGRALSILGAAAGLAVVATVVSTQVFGPGDGGNADLSAQVGSEESADRADEEVPAAQGESGAEGADEAGAEDAEEEGTAGGVAVESAEDESGGSMGVHGDDDAATAAGDADTGPVTWHTDSDLDLTGRGFAAQVGQWYAGALTPAAGEPAPAGLHRCVAGLGDAVPGTAEVTVSEVTFDGAPAVLVLRTEPAPMVAWALDASCVDGTSEVLQGPATVQ